MMSLTHIMFTASKESLVMRLKQYDVQFGTETNPCLYTKEQAKATINSKL